MKKTGHLLLQKIGFIENIPKGKAFEWK